MNCPVVLSGLALTASTLKLTAGSSAPGLAVRDDCGHCGQQSRHETGRLRQDSEPGPRDASFDVSCRCVDHCPTGLAFPSVAIPFSLGVCLAWSPSRLPCLSCAPGPALSQQLQPRTANLQTTTSSSPCPLAAVDNNTTTQIPSRTQAKEGGSSCNPADPRFDFSKPKPELSPMFQDGPPPL